MAVVRCPIHNIPYNDRNPRGCPACFAEKQGEDGDAAIMRQLARLSRGMPALPDAEPAPPVERPGTGEERPSWPPPVTPPPRVPTRALRIHEKLWHWIREHRAATAGGAAVAITVVLVWIITRPDFVPAFDPALPAGDPLPVPVEVHMPVEGVFARLGGAPPTLNPDSPELARYRYGSAAVDALNRTVYAVTLTSPARTWKGIRPGVAEEAVRSTLSLLGTPREVPGPGRAPVRVGSYQVYTSADDRPRRTLVTAVRPPNGCYDVVVELVPRVVGRLAQGAGDAVVVARRGAPMEWAADRVRIVSRALPGPYAGPPVCDPTLPTP